MFTDDPINDWFTLQIGVYQAHHLLNDLIITY
jgi:hypothetical protein